MLNKINIIYGCTSSGKSAYSVKLAKELNGEIINADSVQIYKQIPIISGQPTENEKQNIEHYLYGYWDIFKPYSVASYVQDALKAINMVLDRKKVPIIVGGSGMYIKALVEGLSHMPNISEQTEERVRILINKLSSNELYQYLSELDPLSASKIHCANLPKIVRALKIFLQCGTSIEKLKTNARRPTFARDQYFIIWLNPSRDTLYKKIDDRFIKFIENGAIFEIAELVRTRNDYNFTRAHGLPEIKQFLHGSITYDEMISKAQQMTRNYAKRQLTWARHQMKFDKIIEAL